MPSRRRAHLRSRAVGGVCLVALFASVTACSGGDSGTPDTTVPDTIALPPVTTQVRPTTTTSTTEVATTTSTTVAEEPPTFPLTGLPLPYGFDPARPAMVVKLDNHPRARPQSGLNEADIVFEENVEQLTRFAAVFHSNVTDPVGPIRSGRTQDIDLLGSFNRPLFVWSGGNRRVTDAIVASDLHQISPAANGPFFRTERPGPHDLYANMTDLYALTPPDPTAPLPQFEYRDEDTEVAGEPADGLKISMDGVRVRWQWDAATSSYLRFSDDAPHKDTVFDAQVSTHNVVVLFVEYRPSPADGRSPEAQTIGTGFLWVYSGGRLEVGSWSRADRLSPFVLSDADGAPILLTPGRTFVELTRIGKAVTVEPGADATTVAYP